MKKKNKTNKSDTSKPNNNFGLLSGILSNFHIGVFNTCASDDNSWFCKLSRFVSTLFMIIIICVIIYFIYTFGKEYFT